MGVFMRFEDEFGNGWYEINEFPGCESYIAVSNNAYIKPELRGQGLGQRQHHERLERARNMGFKLIMCTVDEDNAVEKHILRKNGWSLVRRINPYNDHWVQVWMRSL